MVQYNVQLGFSVVEFKVLQLLHIEWEKIQMLRTENCHGTKFVCSFDVLLIVHHGTLMNQYKLDTLSLVELRPARSQHTSYARSYTKQHLCRAS
jgi:hypothetical protein